jgi:hypothetical protein
MSTNPKLNAEMDWNEEDKEVVVYFGQTEVARLVPARASKASKGDDAAYFKAEDADIVEETVAPLLVHLFEKAQEELGYE